MHRDQEANTEGATIEVLYGADFRRRAMASIMADAAGYDLVDRATGRRIPTDNIQAPGDLHPDEHSAEPATTPRAGSRADPAAAGVPETAGQNSTHPAGAEVAPITPAPARAKRLHPKRRPA